MNVDHVSATRARSRRSSILSPIQFYLLDAEQLSRPPNASSTLDEDVSVVKHNKKELYRLLIQEFSELPKAQNLDHDNYGVVNVAPSLVPTYLPSFRIFVYNTTGELYDPGHLGEGEQEQPGGSQTMKDVAGPVCAAEAYERTWRCQLTKPWHSNPGSPSRTNRLWTPLGYAQVSCSVLGLIRHTGIDRNVARFISVLFAEPGRGGRGRQAEI